MDIAYTDYLAAYEPFTAEEQTCYQTDEQDREKLEEADQKLWELCHQVLSNALFILNNETGDFNEEEFVYTFPENVQKNPRLHAGIGHIMKVGTLPTDGIVWLVTETGEEFNDDDQKIHSWELYCIANVLYAMSEPIPYIPD